MQLQVLLYPAPQPNIKSSLAATPSPDPGPDVELQPRAQGQVAGIVIATIAMYVPLTIGVTEWRGRVRKRMNQLDNDLGARATDMLLNYETVQS